MTIIADVLAREILDSRGKPYLILQLDEHDSNIGYETRIEAGVRSFRNHFAACASTGPAESPGRTYNHLPVNPRLENDLSGKTLLFPNWESITAPLLVANLQAAGIDARLLEEDETIDSLRDKVQAAEKRMFPEALRLFHEGRLKVEGRRVRILPKG